LQLFSDAHLAAVGFMILAAALLVWGARRAPGGWTTAAAWVLAVTILAAWAGEYLARVAAGTWTVRYDLPVQLTDAISLASILALVTRRMLLVELTFFWALTAALQAVLTPDLSSGFPSLYYFTFFGYHVGAVLAACFLVFGCRLYPRRGAVWRVYATTLVVTLVAGVSDALTGGDYMFLRAKPAHDSLLDLMGPWPWYLLSTAALALALLFVVKLLGDHARRHDASRPSAPTGRLGVHAAGTLLARPMRRQR
jgi:hypothetical integral membrane protein (TIGR02206 family)